MATRNREGPVTFSVLDRLIKDPRRSEDERLTRAESLRRFKESVCRDLEWLLNTRQPKDMPANVDLQRSLYAYGLPDISSLSASSVRDRQVLTKAIEETIAIFEPRIANLRVSLVPAEKKVQSLRFVIEGLLRMDPSPEPISFDTLLDLSSGEYRVPGESSAR